MKTTICPKCNASVTERKGKVGVHTDGILRCVGSGEPTTHRSELKQFNVVVREVILKRYIIEARDEQHAEALLACDEENATVDEIQQAIDLERECEPDLEDSELVSLAEVKS